MTVAKKTSKATDATCNEIQVRIAVKIGDGTVEKIESSDRRCLLREGTIAISGEKDSPLRSVRGGND